ncbi:apoptosis-antagonizing transcription factor [Pisolithus croceorrhizus]|nr:apoptosis-antagonizing transcription factor [Pisolithus croceorrhizus]
MQRLSLAQQIAELEDVAPADFDPEDVETRGADPEGDAIKDISAARADYVHVGPSALRIAHDEALGNLADPKYEGIKTSRKDLMDNASESDVSDEEDLDNHANEDDDVSDTRAQAVHEPPSSEDEVDHLSEHEAGSSVDGDSIKEPGLADSQDYDLFSNLRKTREEDRKRGKAISKQIALWDSLIDARIRLQKSVTAGNRLPQLSQHADSEAIQGSLVTMLEQAQLLSDELFSFQETLLSPLDDIQLPPRKRQRSDAESSVSDYAEALREASSYFSSLQHTYHPHLIETLNKWSSKIQSVAPSVLLPSNRNAFSKSSQHSKSAAELIDETLTDHNKVLARTRVYRGKNERLGIKVARQIEQGDDEDPTIFDDTDFYQQLLRDVIDSRNGSGGGDDWATSQKQQKAKKKVDTRASKGRKLRYQVHEKIQNFMVPIPVHSGWHDEQIDELFASLLGKGFESAMRGVGEVVHDDAETLPQNQVDPASIGGFRIFG